MQPLPLHGAPRRLLSLFGDGTSIDLIGYADGSFGIDQNGTSIGTWLASEEVECVKVFYQLGELQTATHCVVISRSNYHAATIAARSAQANLN